MPTRRSFCPASAAGARANAATTASAHAINRRERVVTTPTVGQAGLAERDRPV